MAVVFVILLGPLDLRHPVAWIAIFMFAVLLWLPMTIRWARAARETQKAFRDGLADR